MRRPGERCGGGAGGSGPPPEQGGLLLSTQFPLYRFSYVVFFAVVLRPTSSSESLQTGHQAFSPVKGLGPPCVGTSRNAIVGAARHGLLG